MQFSPVSADFGDFDLTGESLCTLLHPGAWVIETGFTPPPAHRPERLLAEWPCDAACAISLSTATLLQRDLGQAIAAWIQAAGREIGPLAGLALHELLLNAAIHGNLAIGSGASTNWRELSQRQTMIANALQDKAHSARLLTVAIGWNARLVALVVADQGGGYQEPPQEPAMAGATRAAGRGLKIARRVGRLEVLDGGRCAAFLLDHACEPELAVSVESGWEIETPIIVLDPDAQEARCISDWLRSAGLGTILTARTCEEAIFILGRQDVSLLIIDESLSLPDELRVLRHITAGHTRTSPPIVRLISDSSTSKLALGHTMASEVVQKPLELHDVVVRVGTALQRNDLLGHLDRDRNQSADHLETARRMQLGLLPTGEQIRALEEECGVGLAGLCRSGEAVGGDFWAAWPTGRGRLALAVVDFAGHGLSAALNTFRLHAILSEQTLPRGAPRRMTSLLNRRLHALLPRGHYATMIYTQIDPANYRLAWSSAAGPPPIFVSATGGAVDLSGRGLPLGVKADAVFQGYSARLPGPGVLCLFSDGLYECGASAPDIPRQEIAGALSEAARLAGEARLTEAAQLGVQALETLRNGYVCPDHSDDVMAICAAIGPAARQI